jgi:hypothetical protein
MCWHWVPIAAELRHLLYAVRFPAVDIEITDFVDIFFRPRGPGR